MTWAQRLKRVFSIEIEKCERCGGKVKIIACIEDADVIEKILKHLGLDEASRARNRSPANGTIRSFDPTFLTSALVGWEPSRPGHGNWSGIGSFKPKSGDWHFAETDIFWNLS